MIISSYILKLVGPIIGKVISQTILIYEAKSLTEEEKLIIKNYDGSPSLPLTKEQGADNLIKKSIVTMSTINRAIFTEKGQKIKTILEKLNF